MRSRNLEGRIEKLHAARRKAERANGTPPQFIDDGFPEQAAFIRDPAKFKVAFCTRRAGKHLVREFQVSGDKLTVVVRTSSPKEKQIRTLTWERVR